MRTPFYVSLYMVLAAIPCAGTMQQNSPATSAAQQSTAANTDSVVKVNTRLVLVDAVVTDKHGKPITDLKREEVEILENGKPQNVRVMSLQLAGAAHADSEPPVRLPPNGFSNFTQAVASGEAPTILLLDALNMETVDQAYARQQMLKYLKSQAAGHRIAIFLLGTRLRMLQDFTTNPDLLVAAMKRLSPQKGYVVADGGTQDTTTDRNDGLPSSADPLQASMNRMAQNLAEFEKEADTLREGVRFTATMDALEDIAHHYGGYVGRKNLIWLTAAFPLSFTDLDRLTSTNLQRMPHTAKVLTDAQIAVYPVDARGLVPGLVPDVSSSGRDMLGTEQTAARLAGKGLDSNTPFVASHEAMKRLAADTGGRAFYDTNDLGKAVEHSVADAGAYYMFGYYPEDKKWAGEFRNIQVKISRKDTEVHARKGYFAASPNQPVDIQSQRAKEELGQAVQFDQSDWTQIPIFIQVAPGAETVVRFSVAGDDLNWEAMPDGGRKGNFSLVLLAYDYKGNRMGAVEQTADAKLKPKQPKDGPLALHFEQKLKLAAGKYVLKAAVRDNRSGIIGTVHAAVEVPKT